MKKEKGLVFFRKKDADKNVVHFIHKDGSFVAITNIYENIDNKDMREYIMKNAKHITRKYAEKKYLSELLQKRVTDRVTWMSDKYFLKKQFLNFEFINI